MIVKENVNDIKEFNFLYDNVGWGCYDDEVSEVALKNTLYSVSVYEDNEIIGYGRLIGDGACFLYIHDIMVRSDYQGKRIGTLIMNKLMDKVKEYKKFNPYVRVYLGASKNREGFYEKFGFISRGDADLGEGMIYNGD